jgi:anti-sigma factor RsiW
VSTHHFEWHADEGDLMAYLDGDGTSVASASVEAHLLACADCRDRLARMSGDEELEEAWDRLVDVIDRPTVTTVQRLTRGRATILPTVATPATLRAALVAVTLIGLVPLASAVLLGEGGLALLLLLAPLAPAAAVAISYREWSDPAGEITLASPSAGLRLVAMRALVVSGLALPLVVGVVWLSDMPIRLAFAWCLPGAALAAIVLVAGTTRLDPLHAAVAISAGWVLLLGIPAMGRRGQRAEEVLQWIADPALQTSALLIAVAALLLTALRRDAVAYRRIV